MFEAACLIGCSKSANTDSLDIAPAAENAPALPSSPRASADAIDVLARTPQNTTPLPEPTKVLLSEFTDPNTKRVIKVAENLRSSRNGRIAGEDLEERIWNLLVAHTPSPYELVRAKSADKSDSAWATLSVSFKRVSTRLRRASKTAPWRSRANFGLSMQLKLPDKRLSSWNNFDFKFEDEYYAEDDLKINAAFWQALENRIPTFTTALPGDAASWARSLGLITTRLSNDFPEKTELPPHRYFNEGCILYEKNGQTYVQQLISAFAPPRPLSMASILALDCSRDAMFVFSVNGQNDLDLYFQPSISSHAWKTGIHFDTPVTADNFAYHIDDDLICAWNGARASSARKFEIRCLDRKTGLLRWQTKSINGMVRGFAATSDALTFVVDQAVFSISRDGDLRFVQRLAPVAARLQEARYCQTENALIYSMNPGRVTFLDPKSGDFLWALNTFASEKLFCAPNDIAIFSEAGGYLLAVNAHDLMPLWKFRTVTMPRDMITFAGSLILLMDRAVIALDLQTGRQLTSFSIPVRADRLIRIAKRIFLDTPSALHLLRIE